MRKLRRRECAILPLVLKRKWFDMIERGEKREEYRASTAYWSRRLANWYFRGLGEAAHVVEFRLGYAKTAPRMAYEAGSGYGHWDGAKHPEWGEPEALHFVIRLGERVELLDD